MQNETENSEMTAKPQFLFWRETTFKPFIFFFFKKDPETRTKRTQSSILVVSLEDEDLPAPSNQSSSVTQFIAVSWQLGSRGVTCNWPLLRYTTFCLRACSVDAGD